jgi:Cys-tRNA(Pro)/Cys-tRNA(Cys) deacylase
MTPAINTAKQAKIDYTVHEYVHDPASESYGLEAAEKLGVAANRVFKTLVLFQYDIERAQVVDLQGKELAVGLVPVETTLNLKLMAKALGAKKVSMAAAADVERATGYVLGGVSPLGQKRKLKTIIDKSARRSLSIASISFSSGFTTVCNRP